MTDQSARRLGLYWCYCRTPHLDRLASGGRLFHQCVTNSPLCVPARMALATGQYPHNSGVWDNMMLTRPPIHQRGCKYGSAGYRTSLFGKRICIGIKVTCVIVSICCIAMAWTMLMKSAATRQPQSTQSYDCTLARARSVAALSRRLSGTLCRCRNSFAHH